MVETFIDGIISALKEEFGGDCRIYTEPKEQGLSEPCFFVFCISPGGSQFIGSRYKRMYQFAVHYFPESVEIKAEFNAVIERLQACLEYITADGDLHRGIDMDSAADNDVLHFFVNYSFFVRKLNESDPMEDLTVDIGG